MNPVKLSQLEFDKYDSWRVLEDSYEEEEHLLLPAIKNEDGKISRENGEVWCLSKAIFSNGEEFSACTMARGDSGDTPRLWTVFYNNKLIQLFVAPAPDFVLELDGPEPFCKEFNLHPTEIFPLSFEILCQFEHEPTARKVLVYEDGAISQL